MLLVEGTFFLYVSQHRLVDDDEGYYLLASRLVIEHKTPYLDFFYHAGAAAALRLRSMVQAGGISCGLGACALRAAQHARRRAYLLARRA